MRFDDQTRQSLVQLGLTALEADIYVSLLQDSPVTGYAAAKAIGKPAANVYKALETLEAKGAVEIERSRARLVRPTPWRQLLEVLELRFRRHRDQAAEGLHLLPEPERDARIYHLRDPDQVLGKARQILAAAQTVALIDVNWAPFHELKPAIKEASLRGTVVAVKVYDKTEIEGADVILDPRMDLIRTRWPAQWIVMTVDGSQILLAMLTADGSRVVQAVWSSSPFLAWIHHSSLHHELAFTALLGRLKEGITMDPLTEMETLEERYGAPDAEGYRRLRGQLGLAETTLKL